ncbi:MAG: protease pro-enzyme activation domain-containing protein [Candidatus Sulfotelmatobacter sp.]
MFRKHQLVFPVLVVTLALAWSHAAQAASAQSGPSRALITAPVDASHLATLVGNTRLEANARNDRGRVSDGLQLDHMLLQLKRAPEVERDFAAYIETLTDKSSPNFRHWMSAAEQGEKYGLAQSDVDAITGWLRSQGFTVGYVYPNRMVIDFSGTAGQIRNAFNTEIHYLSVRGERHIANMSDPKIPAALAPAIHGVVSMHDFKPHNNISKRMDYTFSGCGGTCYALVPADFQTIYNLNPVYSGGTTGAGQTVAVVEDTNSFGSDWANYQSKFGLTSFGGTLTTTHPNDAGNCTNPGTNSADIEADLDVEMVTAVAPGAAVNLISCADTSTTFGGLIAIQNTISAPNPPPIMSMSYSVCEVLNGAAANASFNTAFQSAAAAGISVFASAGDEGGSECGRDFSVGSSYELPGIGVTGWSETAYNVSVGGTDYEVLYNALEGGAPQSTYWGATNGTTFGSALSYIPEIPWNDSCASYLIYNVEGFSTAYGTSGFCNSSSGTGFVDTAAGGGGPSTCATGAGNATYLYDENTTCKGYAKPSWQNGIFGNPADGVRDIPDVSMFAANGVWSHYTVICFSDASGGGVPCTGAPSGWPGVGGTSVAAPLMAGIQALVDQKHNIRAGNPNPTYYSIAKAEFGAHGNSSCYSINETAGNSCTFNDITQGDIDIDCRPNGTVFKADCYKPSGNNGTMGTQAISSIKVTNGGSNYTSAPTCKIVGPTNKSAYKSPTGTTIYAGGTPATCTAVINASTKKVTSITLTKAGGGYTAVPSCTLSGGGGTGAKCMSVITPTVAPATYQPAFGATPGWDLATGLGSPNGLNLVNNAAW